MSSILIFIAYCREDQKDLEELHKELIGIKEICPVSTWYDRDINAGDVWEDELKQNLETAKIILLLITRDFLSSDYCMKVEFKRAMERHKSGDARVIPIILRDCSWKNHPEIKKLQILPSDGVSIDKYENRDTAFVKIADGLRKVLENIQPLGVSPPQELKPPPKRTSSSKTIDLKEKPVISSKDELMKTLMTWISHVHCYSGTTIDELISVYENITRISPSLNELEMISYLQDPKINTQFRHLLLEEFPGYSDKEWVVDWTLKLFLFLKSKEFANSVPLREISEPIRSKLRSHTENFRGATNL
jgi:hypothetical protein